MSEKSELTKFAELNYKKLETKRLIIFLALCFGAAWAMIIFGVMPAQNSASTDEKAITEAVDMISQVMLTPALAALVARIATREGLVKSGFQFNFLEYKFLFLFGWFGTYLLTVAGAALYFIIFRSNFDPNMTKFVAEYSMNVANASESQQILSAAEITAAFKADLIIKFFTAAVLDILNAFAFEWGFRAYLLPKLFRKIGTIPSMLVCGLASGLWYAPLVAMGYNYGEGNAGFPIVNILAMCVFGMVTGVIYSYLALRTGSIFPSVFAHSAVNVMMTQAQLFTFDGGNPFIGPAPTGIIAGIPFIIAAAVCLYAVHKNPIQANTEES